MHFEVRENFFSVLHVWSEAISIKITPVENWLNRNKVHILL